MESVLTWLKHRLRPSALLEVWYDEAYRMPLPSLELAMGVEPRRVEFAAWFLVEKRALTAAQLKAPPLVSYQDILRVHDPSYVESLQQPETLARVFGVDPSEIAVEPLLKMIRLAAGGTLAGARSALSRNAPSLNLSGGFHHAAPAHGGGFCAINDIAIAVSALRAEGFLGQVAYLDFDAHPPDGTSLCLKDDPKVWMGSISGSVWDALAGVDEVVLEPGAGDVAYLAALVALLARMPAPDLAFVIAGADVLHNDRYGKLGLSLQGARRRDWLVAQALRGVPQVWLPGGGYHPDAWKVLAGTGLVLTGKAGRRVPRRYDPLSARLSHISRHLSPRELAGEWELTQEDIEGDLGNRAPPTRRLLGYYTASGVEYALYRHGILTAISNLGYQDLRVELDATDTGDRFRLFGSAEGKEHLLIEAVLERRRLGGEEFLFVNWLTLRNPRAQFAPMRPQLPGQEVPGLGMSREATELLALIAKRLCLAGVAFRPAWFHLASAARQRFRFVDPERQGRFEALVRDARALPLVDASRAVADGRALLNGAPYTWEPTDMVAYLQPEPAPQEWRKRADEEADRASFTFAT